MDWVSLRCAGAVLRLGDCAVSKFPSLGELGDIGVYMVITGISVKRSLLIRSSLLE